MSLSFKVKDYNNIKSIAMTKEKDNGVEVDKAEVQTAVEAAEREEREEREKREQSVDISAEVVEWVQQMSQVPHTNIKGAGSTQENRCSPNEVNAVTNAMEPMFGIGKPTALTAVSELIRRGGGNQSTPDTFGVEIKCPVTGTATEVTKKEVSTLVARHASGKNMRNLAEGMAEGIVIYGVDLVRKQGVDRPGDLAKKIDNRLAFEKQPPLTREERVGCASYAQWLPHLDQLVSSNRLKSLLAKDLELRKSGRVQSQTKQGNSAQTGQKSQKGGKGGSKGKKGKKK